MRRSSSTPLPWICSCVVMLVSTCLPAQQQDPNAERVLLRVVAVRTAAQVVVDRGSRSGLRIGDRVLVLPRNGRPGAGAVIRLEERTALVQLEDRRFSAEPGMAAEVLIPLARRPQAPPDSTPTASKPAAPKKRNGAEKDNEPAKRSAEGKEENQPTPPASAPALVDHPGWQRQDDFRQGQPLLSGMRPVRPSERPTRWIGHAWLIGELSEHESLGSSETFLRAGARLDIDNPLQRGGALRVDVEFDYLTETNDQRGVDLLVRELSYVVGGDRFDRDRLQFGRFLQTGMPEFGILDGIEWSRRSGDRRHRVGASIGFMPEPNEDHKSLADFQIGAHWLWVADDAETLSAGVGMQKTLHHGKFDRDLLIGKLRYLPANGTDLTAIAWIDFYDGRADVKPFAELTRLHISAGRRGATSGYDLSFVHQRFPELFFAEVSQALLPADLDAARIDMIRAGSWWHSGGWRWHHRWTGFVDDDGTGGAVEGGADIDALIAQGGRTSLVLFGNSGRFTTVIGGRLQHEQSMDDGRWYFSYELANHHQRGFPNDGDDLLQHRLRAERSYWFGSSWQCVAHVDAWFSADSHSFGLGIFLQRNF